MLFFVRRNNSNVAPAPGTDDFAFSKNLQCWFLGIWVCHISGYGMFWKIWDMSDQQLTSQHLMDSLEISPSACFVYHHDRIIMIRTRIVQNCPYLCDFWRALDEPC